MATISSTANWDFIHDNETGVFGYTWAAGEEICGTEVSDLHKDPHAHLFDASEWSHEGLVINLKLPGMYANLGFGFGFRK